MALGFLGYEFESDLIQVQDVLRMGGSVVIDLPRFERVNHMGIMEQVAKNVEFNVKIFIEKNGNRSAQLDVGWIKNLIDDQIEVQLR